MSEDAHAAQHFAEQVTAQASARVASPNATEMLDSLVADYKAGKLPDDVKEHIETLRDEWYEGVKDRMTDLKNDVMPDIDTFVNDIKAQVQSYEADGGTFSSEVMDSRQVPLVVNVIDGIAEKIVEPVIDAVEDVVHDTFDFADQLLQIRADHDPEGIYAAKLEAAQEELGRADDRFDEDMGKVHDDIAVVRERLDDFRAEAEEFHEHHEPVQFIMSTTVDPNLPEQMAEETGEGAA
jgi:archaellum component FlaC